MTYLDAVLDENMNPLFNGTPEETKEWLETTQTANSIRGVFNGRTLRIIPVSEYLGKNK